MIKFSVVMKIKTPEMRRERIFVKRLNIEDECPETERNKHIIMFFTRIQKHIFYHICDKRDYRPGSMGHNIAAEQAALKILKEGGS